MWRPHTEIHFPGTTLPVVASCTPSIIDTEEAIAVVFPLCIINGMFKTTEETTTVREAPS